jgi:hypothetical protein
MCSKRNYKGFYRTPRNCNGPTKIVNERVDLHDVLVEKRMEYWGGCECVCVIRPIIGYIYIYAKKTYRFKSRKIGLENIGKFSSEPMM